MTRSARMAAALILLLPAAPAAAQDSVVIYRCTDASGALTMQNDVPCPAGTRQQREVIESPLSPLAPAYMPPEPEPPPQRAPAPEAQATAVPAAEIQRAPPPALYQCRTWDNDGYLTDDSVPAERCAPLQTVGIGGAPGIGAGAACEMVVDACEPLAAEGLCEGWQRRLREAEAALRFGRYESRQAAEAEIERVDRIVSQSQCSG
ncbi:MAG: DUF4124 domain-containing protein [Lysobacter sp.]|nr:DUF4124 domain-containing protein [Lysobacter sp.]